MNTIRNPNKSSWRHSHCDTQRKANWLFIGEGYFLFAQLIFFNTVECHTFGTDPEWWNSIRTSFWLLPISSTTLITHFQQQHSSPATRNSWTYNSLKLFMGRQRADTLENLKCFGTLQGVQYGWTSGCSRCDMSSTVTEVYGIPKTDSNVTYPTLIVWSADRNTNTVGEPHDPSTLNNCKMYKTEFEWNHHPEISRQFHVLFFSGVYGRTLGTTHQSFLLDVANINEITSPGHHRATKHNIHQQKLHAPIQTSPIHFSAVMRHFFSSQNSLSLVLTDIVGHLNFSFPSTKFVVLSGLNLLSKASRAFRALFESVRDCKIILVWKNCSPRIFL